ncbi:uncharacterized protein LOC143026924 [Oratosquilla oratoria]|uniref:uncharacterized protein LOC143026924 n=1 Tax=Oratosquilla oratoria TaxID=337810 RepID=UPI003F76C73E
MAIYRKSLRFVSSRLSLVLVIALSVASSEALPSISTKHEQMSQYPHKEDVDLWNEVDARTCRCTEYSQTCEVEIGETAVVRIRGQPCSSSTRYCCMRKTSSDVAQDSVGPRSRLKLLLHRPKRSSELNPLPEPKRVLVPNPAPSPPEHAWTPHGGPEDGGSLKYLHSQLDLYLTNGVPTSNVVVKTDDQVFIPDKQDRFESFMYEDAITNTKNAIAIDSDDFEYYSAGLRGGFTAPSKLSACSCTTPEECVRLWSPELSTLPMDIRTTLKCEGLHEIVCCFGRIIPPRENRAKDPAIQQDLGYQGHQEQQQLAHPSGEGLLSNLWRYIMSWLN